MIAAPPGVVALYTNPPPCEDIITERKVIAFDDDGQALVLLSGSGGLTPASMSHRYKGLREGPLEGDICAVIPAGGWRVEYFPEEGSPWSEPLTAWGLDTTGVLAAMATDSDGFVEALRDTGGKYRIYHPDQTPPGKETGTT